MATPEQLVSARTKGSRLRNGQRKLDGATSQKTAPSQHKANPKPSPDPFETGYDFLIINSPMEAELFRSVVSAVSKRKKKTKNKKLVLILVSYGGLADAAYKTGRYLQSVYEDITAFIPSSCKSAGTLLAVAAKTLIMSPFGELGPLDVQLRKKDEIFGRRSGLITRSAINDLQSHTFEMFETFMLGITSHSYGNVSFKVAADISARMATDIMSKIYEQINPDSLGQDFRDLSVATSYCERLAKWSKNITAEGIKRLVHEYPSHDFVIDSEESKEIFLKTGSLTPSLIEFLTHNYDCVKEPRDSSNVVIKIVEQGDNDGQPEVAPGVVNSAAIGAAANGRDGGAEVPASG